MKPAVAPTALALWRSTAADTARGVGAAARPAVTVCSRAIQVAARSASARARSASARAVSAAWCRRALSIASRRGPQRERDAQVVGSVRRVRLGRDEADRASTLPRAAIGTTQRGVQRELRDHGADLGIRDVPVQQAPVDVLDQLGLACARHLRRPDRCIGRQGRRARSSRASATRSGSACAVAAETSVPSSSNRSITHQSPSRGTQRYASRSSVTSRSSDSASSCPAATRKRRRSPSPGAPPPPARSSRHAAPCRPDLPRTSCLPNSAAGIAREPADGWPSRQRVERIVGGG